MNERVSSGDRVLIIAAEDSSCLYALRLMQKWKKEGLKVEAFGIGNQMMIDEGFQALARAEELAVVGLSEVIKHWGEISSAFHRAVDETKKRQPNFILLLDYPDFNLRMAKKLKPLGIPIVYFISPQLWAWRKGRIHQIKKLINKMLVLFSFEKTFYQSNDVDVEFVGHPLLDEIRPELFSDEKQKFHRKRYGVQDDEILLGLMPGSRTSELKHHLKVQLETASAMKKKFNKLKVAMLIAPSFSKERVLELMPETDLELIFLKAEPMQMISNCDLILTASGTATLNVGIMKKPMVIMYRMNAFSAFMAKLFVKNLPGFGLVNIVLGKKVAPEFFQEQAQERFLVDALSRFVEDENYKKNYQCEIEKVTQSLGQGGAIDRVYQATKGFLSHVR